MSFTGTNITCVRSDRDVFQQLNFSIDRKEVLYLRGPNGSGKSSLLRIMAGLLRPAAGTLYWYGENILDIMHTYRENFHYVSHQNAVKGTLSVRENLEFWTSMHVDQINSHMIDETLENFQLDNLASLPARFLSVGQVRRLNLARLNTSQAALWLLDEPFSTLDEESSTLLKEAIFRHLTKDGMVAMATHGPALIQGKVLNLPDYSFQPIKIDSDE